MWGSWILGGWVDRSRSIIALSCQSFTGWLTCWCDPGMWRCQLKFGLVLKVGFCQENKAWLWSRFQSWQRFWSWIELFWNFVQNLKLRFCHDINWKLKIGQNIDKSSKHRFVKVLHEFEEKKTCNMCFFPFAKQNEAGVWHGQCFVVWLIDWLKTLDKV